LGKKFRAFETAFYEKRSKFLSENPGKGLPEELKAERAEVEKQWEERMSMYRLNGAVGSWG